MENIVVEVISVNISEKKGTAKTPVAHIDLNNTGVAGDAHSGLWHRQVSLLGQESVLRFSAQAGREIASGEFAENITTRGLELVNTLPLDRLISQKAELEITQIGKKCHGASCSIFQEVGNCVMPKEGIFARVVRGGRIEAGDTFSYHRRRFRILVITLSDRASRGEYEDKSGPAINNMLKNHFEPRRRDIDIENIIIADDETLLKQAIGRGRKENFDFIITTGGTGIGSRDISPDIIRPMLDKEIPGIMEMIRVKYGAEKPNALLSRGVAGLLDSCFIYTLPGSVKAVNEYMGEILKTMEHLVYMLNGLDVH